METHTPSHRKIQFLIETHIFSDSRCISSQTLLQLYVQRGPGSNTSSEDLEESHYVSVARSSQSQVSVLPSNEHSKGPVQLIIVSFPAVYIFLSPVVGLPMCSYSQSRMTLHLGTMVSCTGTHSPSLGCYRAIAIYSYRVSVSDCLRATHSDLYGLMD